MSRAHQTIFIVSPEFPPFISGVGDHTANLAAAVNQDGKWKVKVFTSVEPIINTFSFPIQRAFDVNIPRSISFLVDLVVREQPSWVIIQYNPFSYGGRYGSCFHLIKTLYRIKRKARGTKIGIIVHESFIPVQGWRSCVLSMMLKIQLWCACSQCNVVFATVDPWTKKLRTWFPKKKIEHLPVGSNVPYIEIHEFKSQKKLNIEENTIVLGYFGRIRGSRSIITRNLEHLTATVRVAQEAKIDVIVLYLGLDPEGARQLLGHLPLLALGPLTPQEISVYLRSVDVFLLPITGGISTRRTSLMCAMQHRLPIVATSGADTDVMLHEQNYNSFILIPEQDVIGFATTTISVIRDAAMREKLSIHAQALFQREFSWKRIGGKFIAALG